MEETVEYGKRLGEARAKLGVTLEEVSYELKINLNTLKNLEASESKLLPKPGFTKGLIKAYCKFLNVSPALIIEEYTKTVSSSEAASSAVLQDEVDKSSFFIIDFLKDQLFPLLLFVSVVCAAFVIYSFLGRQSPDSYETTLLDPVKSEHAQEKKPKEKEVVFKEVVAVTENDADSVVETAKTAEDSIVEEEKKSSEPKIEQAVLPKTETDKLETEGVERISEEPDAKVFEKPKYTPPTGKHRLVVEPLEKTYLYIKTNTDKHAVKASLMPDRVRTFRFDQAEIRFLDIGAVNITLDDEELGALGVFGEEKTIDFPSLKEL